MVALGACSSDEEKDKYVEEPVNTLYNRGMDALAEQRYPAAAKALK